MHVVENFRWQKLSNFSIGIAVSNMQQYLGKFPGSSYNIGIHLSFDFLNRRNHPSVMLFQDTLPVGPDWNRAVRNYQPPQVSVNALEVIG